MEKNSKIKTFEGFSWIWAFSQACKNLWLNIDIVGISEIRKFSEAVFKYNHGEVKNFWDITKIDYNSIPDFDIGGFW